MRTRNLTTRTRNLAMRTMTRLLRIAVGVSVLAGLVTTGAAAAGAETGAPEAGWQHRDNPACPDRTRAAQQAAGRFADIGVGTTHAANIGCIAYYGVTVGAGDGTRYAPKKAVTRWQMALFLTRAATRAGVELPARDATVFHDIAGRNSSAQDAIYAAAALGIMPSPYPTAFSPNDNVTRADMALFLARLLELTTDHNSPIDVTIDDGGQVDLTRPGGTPLIVDDSFPDTRTRATANQHHAIAAMYELGITSGKSDGTYDPDGTVTRAQMASFIVRALGHTSVRPAGLITLQTVTPTPKEPPPDPDGIYTGDPLRLIAHAPFVRAYSLPGPEGDRYEVWLCNTPDGSDHYSMHPDSRHNPSNYATQIADRVTDWFDWLSEGQYLPVFRAGGVVDVDRSSESYTHSCGEKVAEQFTEQQANIEGVIIVADLSISDPFVASGSCGIYGERGYPSNRRLVMANGNYFTDPTVLAHEMGHALCWPHSFSGVTYNDRRSMISEYDNPMDVVSSGFSWVEVGTLPTPTVGTPAINRYTAGWIPVEQTAVHTPGTTARYQLGPIGSTGTQMLVVPYDAYNLSYYLALGVRVRGTGDLWWADSGIIAEGVEIYSIDQTLVHVCHSNYYCGTDRRVRPLFDADDGYDADEATHVMATGDGWYRPADEDGPGFSIDVISRSGDTFTVEVKPYTKTEPDTDTGYRIPDTRYRISESDDAKWRKVELDDHTLTWYSLNSQPTTIYSGLTGKLVIECSFSSPNVVVLSNAYVSGDDQDHAVEVSYRAGSAAVQTGRWVEFDKERLSITGREAVDFAWHLAANPGPFLFTWTNSSSSELTTLRFTDTTGLRAALGSLDDCFSS